MKKANGSRTARNAATETRPGYRNLPHHTASMAVPPESPPIDPVASVQLQPRPGGRDQFADTDIQSKMVHLLNIILQHSSM